MEAGWAVIPVSDKIANLHDWLLLPLEMRRNSAGAAVVLGEIAASHADLLEAAEAVLASLRAGLGEITGQGVRSPAFHSRADETAAALRDLKAAVARARGA
jgi:hypothetical protein